MSTICPTITATDSTSYQTQMTRVEGFAARLHIDVADGVFAPRKLLNLDELWWQGDKIIDVHVMYQNPLEHLELLLVQHPNLVIVHAEAEGNFSQLAERLHHHGINVGVALLPPTPVYSIAAAIKAIDHLLIFSGNLGHQGGSHLERTLLPKIAEAKRLKPDIEIGWDGGVNAVNIAELARAGVDVINVGGFIQHATDPAHAYATLNSEVQKVPITQT